MKKAFLLLVLFLIACSAPAPAPTPAPTATQTHVEVTPAEPVASTPPFQDYSMSAATESKVQAGLTSTTKYFLSENFKKLGVGEHVTFGVGYTNRLGTKDNFLVTLTFVKAYDHSTNSIEKATADQVAGWLSHNDFNVASLAADQQKIEPVIIEVQNFADGSAPPSGTYEFELLVNNQATGFQVNTIYAKFPISIQVP